LFIVALSDFFIGNLLRYFYFKQVAGEGYRTTYSIDSTNADVLVFGSSRANHHYVPEIFEESLKMSFYNTGRDGNSILYNCAVFRAIVQRYNPKIVIFDIIPEEFYSDVNSYDRLSSLLPYYRNHPEIRNIVNMKSPYEKFKLISCIYPFNSSLLTIGISNMELNKKRKSDRKGYIPLYNLMNDTTLKSIKTLEGTIDANKVNALYEIMEYCQKHKISSIVVQSPIFASVKSSNIIDTIKQIVDKNNSIFWNFSNDSCFLATSIYFQDQIHLNEKGAICFSKIVANRIKDNNYNYPYQHTKHINSFQSQK